MNPRKKHHKSTKSKRSVLAAISATCQERWAAVIEALPTAATMECDSTAAVHDLRVATRRMLAALELYTEWFPRKQAEWLSVRLEKIRSAIADARDLDVLLQSVVAEASELPEGVLYWLVHRIAWLRANSVRPLTELLRQLKKKRFQQRGENLLSKLRWRGAGHKPSSADQLDQGLHHLVKDVTKLHKKLGRKSLALHQVRVVLKRVRYRLEILGEKVVSPVAKTARQRLADLQDRLGNANDLTILYTQLEEWAAESSDPAIKKSVLAFAARAERRVTESLSQLVDELPRELAELITLLKQLRPVKKS